jgi:hypothetical protein
VEEIRDLSAVAYKHVEKIIYPMKQFIKNIPGAERGAYVGEMLGHFQYILETDYTAFDRTQRHIHLEVERKLVAHIAEHWLPMWEQTTQHPDVVRADGITVQTGKTRKSGEMMTSLGNSVINWIVYAYAKANYFPDEMTDAVFEGDDGLIGTNDLRIVKIIKGVAHGLGLDLKL